MNVNFCKFRGTVGRNLLKFLLLDGSNIKININAKDYPLLPESSCSKLEYKVGQLLRQKYKFSCILQHWTIPNTRMSYDFIVFPDKNAYEIQGKQHFERTDFFHKGPYNFVKQRERDVLKKDFCELNSIRFIEICNEDDLGLI